MNIISRRQAWFHPDWMDEVFFEKGAENSSWHRRQRILKMGWPALWCSSPKGKKTRANQAVLQWLKWSATLVFLSLAPPALASVGGSNGGSPACSGLPDSVWSAEQPFHQGSNPDMTSVKTCRWLEEPRSRQHVGDPQLRDVTCPKPDRLSVEKKNQTILKLSLL